LRSARRARTTASKTVRIIDASSSESSSFDAFDDDAFDDAVDDAFDVVSDMPSIAALSRSRARARRGEGCMHSCMMTFEIDRMHSDE